jgi:hypothetical protein
VGGTLHDRACDDDGGRSARRRTAYRPAAAAVPEPIVRGETAWAVTRDELDVATVVRFRIVHEGIDAEGS